MSGHTFKVGDRVRVLANTYPGRGPATVEFADDQMVRVAWADGGMDRYFYSHELEHVPPMSPGARMVWHAMRAGAKRVGRYHWANSRGVAHFARVYSSDRDLDDGSPHIYLRIDTPVSARKDGES